MTAESARRGHAAEQQALRYLRDLGLVLLQSNYHSRYGEIDLVMQDGDSLVFVEVRYRGRSRYGSAAESVDRHKQSRLIACAQHYLQRHPQHAGLPCRFDVITLGGTIAPDWIRNAFSA